MRGQPRITTLAVAAALVWVALLAPKAPGQQCGPDGLESGECCQPASLTLPDFPAISHDTRYLCFDHCDTRIDADICVDIAVPNPATLPQGPVCGVYLIRFTLKTCSANPKELWTGRMRAFYSRNWTETTENGREIEIWRFLLNGDLLPSDFLVQRFGQNPAAVPPCFFEFGRVHFWGYIDYAFDCGSGQTWQAAWVLDHDCDFFEHESDVSSRPGVFHPGLSYDFVGPAVSFSPGPYEVPASEGDIMNEAVRRNELTALPDICRSEEPITSGIFQPTEELCPCGGEGAPEYVDTEVFGNAECGTEFSTIPGGRGIIQKKIGAWSSGGDFYPGPEAVLLDQGFMTYFDACTQTESTEYFKGVETIGGYSPSHVNGGILGFQFEDLASADSLGGLTVIGKPYVSYFVLNLNLP